MMGIRTRIAVSAALVGLALVPACAVAQARTSVTVFTGVTIVSMDRPAPVPRQTVIVRDGRIEWLGPAQDADIPAGAVLIDGAGKYLMPGLVDVHVHADPTDLPLFLANGVTTIREMNGSAEHLALRDQIARGTRVGPTLYVSSTLLAGSAQRWRHALVPDGPAAALAARDAIARGYDFLKVYDGLSTAAYDAIVAAGRAAGVPLTGHVPAGVGLTGVLGAEQRSIEHLEQIMAAIGGAAVDSSSIEEAARAIARAGTRVTPTLVVLENITRLRTPAMQARLDGPELQYVNPDTRAWWQSLRRPAQAGTGQPDPYVERLRLMVRALLRNGVRVLAGTDTPNPLMVPGFSLHEELAALAAAGLSTQAVLRAATLDAAEFLGAPEGSGTVRTGAAADLVLFDADPTVSVGNLRDPAGVMARGRWFPREALQAMLAEVVATYR